MNKPNTATIEITKWNAASRQLNTAIRLFLSDEDILAVHTLVVAAYRLLRDLQRKRGTLHFPEVIRVGLWYMAEDYRKGVLADAPLDLMPMIEAVAQMQASGAIKSHAEIPMRNEQAVDNDDLRRSSKAANFLKHADRDSEASLSEGDIDNVDLLSRACATYRALLHAFSPEMAAFVIYSWTETSGKLKPTDPVIAKLVSETENLSPDKRKAACRKLLRNSQFCRYYGTMKVK